MSLESDFDREAAHLEILLNGGAITNREYTERIKELQREYIEEKRERVRARLEGEDN